MRIHFVSIGGSVMHQLALALQHMGHTITGSDDEIFEPALGNLQRAGLLPAQMGWDAAHIQADLDAVILGMHARADNPELLKAQELGLPVYSFPEYMYEASRQKTRVVVGGSHGKTTTTSMIMHALRTDGRSFDFLVGARLEGFDRSVSISNAPVVVCEGDEYPASAIEKRPKFHFLFPHIAVLTGIAWDHINVFPTFENYVDQFDIFIQKIEPGGVLIYNETDPELAALVNRQSRQDIRFVPYGIPEHTISHGQTTISLGGSTAALQVFGNHNLLNLHAAWLVCAELGMKADAFCSAIATFSGAAKRLEVMASNDQTVVFRDFAHAPSKVKATIEAVRQQFPDKRLIAALELHTYSSLSEAFLPHYAGALDAADAACVFYSHHALAIKKLKPISPQAVREGFARPDLQVFTERPDLEQWLQAQNYAHASLLLMSSGTYDGLAIDQFVQQNVLA